MTAPSCRACGKALPVKDPAKPGTQTSYCGPACRRTQIAKPAPSCRVFITDCHGCGTTFATPHTVATCSPRCAAIKRRHDKHEHKHRDRARKRGAYVAPVSRRAIYERDDYRCHLCGQAVTLDQPVPHPRAAVLDHVIPLARGGTHEPGNVRTACFKCNCIKGARTESSDAA